MTTRNTQRIKFFGKEFLNQGLNVTDNPILVPVTQMVQADNILIGSTEARRKRGGTAYFNTDASDETANYPSNPKNGGGSEPIIGMYEYWRYDGSGNPQGTLMIRQGTKIWGIDARTGVATDLTGALTLPAGGKVTFQTFEGNLYWVGTGSGGTPEGFNTWDGVAGSATALAGGDQPPDGTPTVIGVHKGRMWASGVPGFPYRLYYSEFFDATTWATVPFGTTGTAVEAGSLDFDPFGDPRGITGFVSFQDTLFVFMQRAIFQVSGITINDFVIKTVTRRVGCIGHHTIQPIANDVVYATERGVLTLKSTDKAIQSDYGYLSRDISRLWNEGLNHELYEQFDSAYDEEENLYLITCPSLGSTENDAILAYNVESNLWSGVWNGMDARTMATYANNGRPRILIGKEDGTIAITNELVRQDLGEPFSGRFKTGFLYPNNMPDIRHVWKNATILISTDRKASVTINWSIDSKFSGSATFEIDSGEDKLGSSFILGSSKLGNGFFTPQTFSLEGEGYGLQLEVIYNGDADIQVYGFITESDPSDHYIGS